MCQLEEGCLSSAGGGTAYSFLKVRRMEARGPRSSVGWRTAAGRREGEGEGERGREERKRGGGGGEVEGGEEEGEERKIDQVRREGRGRGGRERGRGVEPLRHWELNLERPGGGRECGGEGHQVGREPGVEGVTHHAFQVRGQLKHGS